MANKIVVVDGLGNLRSVAQALRAAAPEAEVIVSSEGPVIDAADRVVLPGQGAMRDCMRSLRESGAEEAVLRAMKTRPVMGVCVGEQMLFDSSEENEGTPGLGLLPGKVVRFQLDGKLQSDGSRFKVPQMGWNRPIPTIRSARPITAARTAAWSRATTSSPPSFTLKKARTQACACITTSSTGIPELLFIPTSTYCQRPCC